MEGTSEEVNALNVNNPSKKASPKKSQQATPKKTQQESPKKSQQASIKKSKQASPKQQATPKKPALQEGKNSSKAAKNEEASKNPKMYSNNSKNGSEPIVIKDNINKPPIFTVKRKKLETKIIFVYKRDKIEIAIKNDLTFNALMPLLDNKLRLNGKKIEIIYKDSPVNLTEKGSTKVTDLIANDPCPFFEVKKVFSENPLKIKNYDYKISVDGIKEMGDLHNQINNFFSTLLFTSDYKIEHFSQSKVQISFTCQEYLFDFYRYLNYLKITNELYSGIIMKKIINKAKKVESSKNANINQNNKMNRLRNKSVPKYSSALYINLSTPYRTPEDFRREEYKESKKKWILPKDFVTAVSGKTYINKYLD